MNEADKAYTAGIIDGEGSISLVVHTSRRTKSGRPATSPKLLIQVSMTSYEVINWLVETWGVGNAYLFPKREAHHKQAWSWRVRGAPAAEILTQILPYMKAKKPQAELGIKAASMKGAAGKKIGDETMAIHLEMREQMMQLNGALYRATAQIAKP